MRHIGFIASINGLGHARRMTHLALSFKKMGFLTTVFATKHQIKRLLLELNLLDKSMNFVEISSHGVDGPVWMKDGCQIETPSNQVISIIEKCDLVISDNSIWPVKFNSNFVLFGHFNWLNYWHIQKKQSYSKEFLSIFEQEISLLRDIDISFQLTNFVLNGVFNTGVNIPVGLMRYESDIKIPKLIEHSTVWIANGTTKLNKNFDFTSVKNTGLNFSLAETYCLFYEPIKPIAVIGRPGLGTIRDCLAAGVLFIPYLEDSDPELESNVLSLQKLSLVSDISFNTSTFSLDLIRMTTDSDLLESWSNIWAEISQDCPEICELILKSTN